MRRTQLSVTAEYSVEVSTVIEQGKFETTTQPRRLHGGTSVLSVLLVTYLLTQCPFNISNGRPI